MKLEEKINKLKPSESLTISELNGIKVIVERSGDGKKLRFVRITKNESVVFSTQSI